MRKLIAAALALAALMVPLAANAVTYLGPKWGQQYPVQWVRGTALQDTVSFAGSTYNLPAIPDTVRTEMIDATGQIKKWGPGLDYSALAPFNGSAGLRHVIKVNVVSFGGVGTDTLPDTLWVNLEQTFDSGNTYVLNTTVATTSSFTLVRDLTNYDVPPTGTVGHPGLYTGYIDMDTDLSATASQANGQNLWLRQFRLRVIPGGFANSTAISRGGANCRMFIQWPEPNLDWGGHGSDFAGLEIARKQVFFYKNSAYSDTLFQGDESDTSTTQVVDISDAYANSNVASVTAASVQNIVKISLVASGANNGAADTVYCTPLLEHDGFLHDYPPISAGWPQAASAVALVRTSLAGNCPALFVGYMKVDLDVASDAAGGIFVGARNVKFFLNGDVGGTTPKLATCRMYVSYPRARIVRN